MAKLKRTSSSGGGSMYNWNFDKFTGDLERTPGTFPGILLDVRDHEGVERVDYNDKSKMVERDITRFLFAYYDDEVGEVMLASTGEMVISGSEKSNLFKLLTAIRGSEPPVNDDAYDTADEIGRKVMVTVETGVGKTTNRPYAYVKTALKCPKKYEADCPGYDVEVPGGRFSDLPEWLENEPEPESNKKKTRATRSKKVDDDEEDPF